ncbi:MAG: hypothetical protein IKF49_09480 [Clostridia bacterium]|nr:hypothetical protein [Clostridia bacterium]
MKKLLIVLLVVIIASAGAGIAGFLYIKSIMPTGRMWRRIGEEKESLLQKGDTF